MNCSRENPHPNDLKEADRLVGNYLAFQYVTIGVFAIFLIIGWNAIRLGNHLFNSGQYSPILRIPDFPFAYGLSLGCFVECLVLLYTIFQNPEERQS